MRLAIDALPDRITAALYGATFAEAVTGTAAGARQLLDLAESLGASGRLDEEDLEARGLGAPPAIGAAGLLLYAVPIALLTPLDRPRLRRTAHRAVVVARGDEGTAMTAVAVACLAADLCRFDLDTALTRVRQTLLEEAPMALLTSLRPLSGGRPPDASGDPVDAVRLALTALDSASTVPEVLDAAAGYGGDAAAAVALAGALAGCRSALAGTDDDWLATVPARARADAAAAALADRALALLPAG